MPKTKPKRKMSFLSGVFLLLNIIAVFLLLLAYGSVYINPNKLSIIAFAGLTYPVILAINLFFILFWIFTRFKFALLSIVFILLGWNHIGRLFQFNTDSESYDKTQTVKVLSYNIQNFFKLNLSSTKYVSNLDNQKKITDFIVAQNADIVCLQELFYDRGEIRKFASKFGQKFSCTNFYYRNYYQNKKNKLDAIAIFTKHQIIDEGFMDYEDKTIGIYTDLIINDDTVRLYNLHLASIHFRKEDYDFISDLTTNTEQQEIKENTLKVISKMGAAYAKRGYQVDNVKRHIKRSPFPVIICGDFNDTPSSYTYRNLAQGREDAFVQSGKGFGITYAGENFPAFRIDYILYDNLYQSRNFIRHKISLSDHYPVSCILEKMN